MRVSIAETGHHGGATEVDAPGILRRAPLRFRRGPDVADAPVLHDDRVGSLRRIRTGVQVRVEEEGRFECGDGKQGHDRAFLSHAATTSRMPVVNDDSCSAVSA